MVKPERPMSFHRLCCIPIAVMLPQRVNVSTGQMNRDSKSRTREVTFLLYSVTGVTFVTSS